MIINNGNIIYKSGAFAKYIGYAFSWNASGDTFATTDGFSWNKINLWSFNVSLGSVFAGGKFAVFNEDGSKQIIALRKNTPAVSYWPYIYTIDSGKTWSFSTSMYIGVTITEGMSLKYIKQYDAFYALASFRLYKSTDLVTWGSSLRTDIATFAYGRGMILALTSASPYCVKSTDGGSTWTNLTQSSIIYNSSYPNMVYGNGYFLVSPTYGSTDMKYTQNGSTWY